MENSKKIGKNLKKFKKIHCGFISIKNKLKKAEKDGKQKLSFNFVPTRHVKKIRKKFKKNSKNLEIPLLPHFKP